MEVYEIPPPRSTGEPRPQANLEIRQYSVVTSSDGYFVWYSPRFQLVETTGRSAAVVVSMTMKPDISLPPATWAVQVPIIAGGSGSIVGADINGYSPDGDVFGFEWLASLKSGITVMVTYRVSDGTERVVAATATANN